MLSLFTGMALAMSLMFSPAASNSADANGVPKDLDITTWVHYALSHDPRTVGWHIAVETRDGIVKLKGEVDNLAAKNYAAAEAKKIHGVRGVINEISVMLVPRPDADIAHDVRRRLENSTAVDARSLVVAVQGGIVTLSGEAADWNQKEEARLMAEGIRGVKEVVDDVQLRFGDPVSDERLAAESRARLARDVYLNRLPITVAVQDGEITLTGSVGNLYEKERAGRSLRWQRGVKSVVNELMVEPWERYGVRDEVAVPSDDELKRNVEAELMTDLRLRPEKIAVEAVAGHVMLFGAVPSLRQKRIAERDVRDVVGVGWVTNDLLVSPMLREDSAIRGQIVFNLGADPYLSRNKIDVSVAEGVVTLSGKVPSLADKQRATDLAIDVQGVSEVINDLIVRHVFGLTDEILKSQVVQRLKDDWKVRWIYEDIQVHANDGVVVLTGDVNNWSERREAGRVALRTQGVVAVDNRLTVRGVPYPWDEWHWRTPGHLELLDPYGGN